jgi:hypothetical protein
MSLYYIIELEDIKNNKRYIIIHIVNLVIRKKLEM